MLFDGFSDAVIELLYHAQLLESLGWKQGIITIFEDSIPAIGLVYSPSVTRKARYMHVRYHFVRQLVARKIIRIEHVSSALQAADLLTHPLTPAKFQRHLYKYFNFPAVLLPPLSTHSVGFLAMASASDVACHRSVHD